MFGSFIPYVNDMLKYTDVNAEVIANNIANFNTPGYKTKTVKFENVLSNEMEITLKNTDTKHINHSPDANKVNFNVVTESDHSTRVDGNNVNQTEEMIKMLKNNYTHNLNVIALNKEFGLYRKAIGR